MADCARNGIIIDNRLDNLGLGKNSGKKRRPIG